MPDVVHREVRASAVSQVSVKPLAKEEADNSDSSGSGRERFSHWFVLEDTSPGDSLMRGTCMIIPATSPLVCKV